LLIVKLSNVNSKEHLGQDPSMTKWFNARSLRRLSGDLY
jgi:hypothetical protein